MKKTLTLLLLCVLMLSLAACGNDDDVTIDVQSLIAEMTGSAVFADPLVELSASKISSEVNLNPDLYVADNSAFYTNSSASGEEFAAFECNSSKDAKALVKELEARRELLQTKYDNYGAEAKLRLSNLLIQQKGRYVVYVSADDHAGAAKIVDKYFG